MLKKLPNQTEEELSQPTANLASHSPGALPAAGSAATKAQPRPRSRGSKGALDREPAGWDRSPRDKGEDRVQEHKARYCPGPGSKEPTPGCVCEAPRASTDTPGLVSELERKCHQHSREAPQRELALPAPRHALAAGRGTDVLWGQSPSSQSRRRGAAGRSWDDRVRTPLEGAPGRRRQSSPEGLAGRDRGVGQGGPAGDTKTERRTAWRRRGELRRWLRGEAQEQGWPPGTGHLGNIRWVASLTNSCGGMRGAREGAERQLERPGGQGRVWPRQGSQSRLQAARDPVGRETGGRAGNHMLEPQPRRGSSAPWWDGKDGECAGGGRPPPPTGPVPRRRWATCTAGDSPRSCLQQCSVTNPQSARTKTANNWFSNSSETTRENKGTALLVWGHGHPTPRAQAPPPPPPAGLPSDHFIPTDPTHGQPVWQPRHSVAWPSHPLRQALGTSGATFLQWAACPRRKGRQDSNPAPETSSQNPPSPAAR